MKHTHKNPALIQQVLQVIIIIQKKMKTLNYRLHSNRNRAVIQMKFASRAAYLSFCRRCLELDVNGLSVISSGSGPQVQMTNIHFLMFILRILMVLLIFHLYPLYAVMLICSIIYCSPGQNKYCYGHKQLHEKVVTFFFVDVNQ